MPREVEVEEPAVAEGREHGAEAEGDVAEACEVGVGWLVSGVKVERGWREGGERVERGWREGGWVREGGPGCVPIWRSLKW